MPRYACLVMPVVVDDDDVVVVEEKKKKKKKKKTLIEGCDAKKFGLDLSIQEANFLQLMFLYLCREDDDSTGEVVLDCRCFSKYKAKLTTIFTLTFESARAFDDELMTNPGLVFEKTRFEVIKYALHPYDPWNKKYVVNRALILDQTNILSFLSNAFAKGASDCLKWYALTAARLVVMDDGEIENCDYPALRASIEAYTGAITRPSTEDFSAISRAAVKNGFGGANLLTMYEEVVSRSRESVINFVWTTREYVMRCSRAAGRLGDIYVKFKSKHEPITHTNVVSANLLYYKVMRDRYQNVSEVLEEADAVIDEGAVDPVDALVRGYVETLQEINDEGCSHIKERLTKTVEVEPFDPDKHKGYEFLPAEETKEEYPCGITQPMHFLSMGKDFIFKSRPFPQSCSKQIRGRSVYAHARLLNSDRKLLMTGESVKDVYQRIIKVPVNTPFLAVKVASGAYPDNPFNGANRPDRKDGYRHCLLMSPTAMDARHERPDAVLSKIVKHTISPCTATFQCYTKAIIDTAEATPDKLIHEIIVPDKPVFALSVDIDNTHLVSDFYGGKVDLWTARKTVHDNLTSTMKKYVKLLQLHQHSPPSKKKVKFTDFSLRLFESIPDDDNHTKVGLRAIFLFRNLAFRNTEVVAHFLTGFTYFLFRSHKSLGNSIDMGMYTAAKGHCLRLPMMAKDIITSGSYGYGRTKSLSRPLIPVYTQPNRSIRPSQGLVHMKHDEFDPDNALVLTSLGDTSSLITRYSSKETEFTLLKNKNAGNDRVKPRFARDYGGDDDDDDADDLEASIAATTNHTKYFWSIANTILLTAIHSTGGGFPDQAFTEVTKKGARYTLHPKIYWCSINAHQNPSGNPCTYTISLRPGNRFSLNVSCFGSACRTKTGIYVGYLPGGRNDEDEEEEETEGMDEGMDEELEKEMAKEMDEEEMEMEGAAP